MYKNMINWRAASLAISIAFVFLFQFAEAQTRISSPYSRFGLGELHFQQNHRNLGMGGLGVGFRSNVSINNVNPASYSAFDTTSFVFEATIFSHFYQQVTQSQDQISNYSSLGNLSFGFPVTSWWGVGLGLKPFSSIGYRIRDLEVDPIVGQVNYLYEGQGGLNQVYIGNGIKVFPGFSLGVNASYIWGSLERHTTVFSDTAGFFLANRILSNNINGWHFGFGAQYQLILSNTSNIIFGATYGYDNTLNATTSQTLRQQLPGFTRLDTISHVENQRGTVNIPPYWGAGTFVRFNPSWAAGVDFQSQSWEDLQMFGRSEDLNNSYQIAFGIQHNPAVQTFANFFNRLEYQAGLRYGQTYLPIGEEGIMNEFGISFGLRIPVRRSLSGLNFGFEYGQRGSTDQHPFRENLYRVNLGINVYERWFIRRRFN
jgi:hypothetical protein